MHNFILSFEEVVLPHIFNMKCNNVHFVYIPCILTCLETKECKQKAIRYTQVQIHMKINLKPSSTSFYLIIAIGISIAIY